METVTISPEYQVALPNEIRDRLNLYPGQKLKAFLYDNRIEMIPVRPVEETRGFLHGINATVERGPDL